MATIGPTLPPHLTSKRKRSSSPSPPSSTSTSPQPPTKRSRPSSPSSPPPQKRPSIGPALTPASLSDLPITPLSDNEEPSSPTIHPVTSIPPSTTPSHPPPTTKTTTTSRPSIPPPAPPASSSSSSSDDDLGPAPAPPPSSTAAHLETSRQSLLHTQREAESAALTANKPAQREEWMLAPPTSMDWGSRIDPTKLKNRKFQIGKSVKRDGNGGESVDRLWTETPEQKQRRLRDEVLGVKARAENAGDGGVGEEGVRERRRREGDEEKARRVREYNERRDRGGSLMDGWKGKRDRGEEGSGEKEDDPSARVFDREKDVGLGVRIGHKARGEMMHKAKDFGGRFAGGKYL